MKERVLEASKNFWTAMEQADEGGMRAVADPDCCWTANRPHIILQ